MEYRLPEEVEGPDFAIIADDDMFITRQMYLKKLKKNLGMTAPPLSAPAVCPSRACRLTH